MTATPRIFGDAVKQQGRRGGRRLARWTMKASSARSSSPRNFSWAVQNGLLTDYKVIVLAVMTKLVSAGVQRLLG